MKRFFSWLLLLYLAVALWKAPSVAHDLRHPELWGEDWQRDPRLYLPMLGLVLAGHAWWAWDWWRWERRIDRQVRELEERRRALEGGCREAG
jgi:hypothetical protein